MGALCEKMFRRVRDLELDLPQGHWSGTGKGPLLSSCLVVSRDSSRQRLIAKAEWLG